MTPLLKTSSSVQDGLLASVLKPPSEWSAGVQASPGQTLDWGVLLQLHSKLIEHALSLGRADDEGE